MYTRIYAVLFFAMEPWLPFYALCVCWSDERIAINHGHQCQLTLNQKIKNMVRWFPGSNTHHLPRPSALSDVKARRRIYECAKLRVLWDLRAAGVYCTSLFSCSPRAHRAVLMCLLTNNYLVLQKTFCTKRSRIVTFVTRYFARCNQCSPRIKLALVKLRVMSAFFFLL